MKLVYIVIYYLLLYEINLITLISTFSKSCVRYLKIKMFLLSQFPVFHTTNEIRYKILIKVQDIKLRVHTTPKLVYFNKID